MKNTIKILAFVMLVVMSLSVLTACELPEGIQGIIDQITGGSNVPDDPDTPADPVTPVDPNAAFTVKWVQGQKVLKEVTVSGGSKLTSWTPSLEGKEFLGWFSDPGLTKAFDFENTTVTADMKVYASFKTTGSVDPVEPELADYFLLGQGLGDLAASGWNHTNAAKFVGMTDKGEGVYEIIITMYAGDKFQIGTGGSWGDGQWGIGCVAGYTMVDDTSAQVTDETGNVIFTGDSGAYNNPAEKMDITLAEGWDGRYKFTFDSNTYTITWDLLESIDPYEPGEVGDDVADVVYLNPGDEWSSDGSMYGAWCWVTGSEGKWYTLTEDDGGMWKLEVPEGCDKVIFVDFNEGADTMDWDNKRVQTDNMDIPTTSKVVYNAATNTWSEK